MNSAKQRPPFYNLFLDLYIILLILGFAFSIVWMCLTSVPTTFYAYGILAIYCLVAIVGLILIQRWDRFGVWLTLIATIATAVIFASLWDKWLEDGAGGVGPVLPWIVTACVALFIVLPAWAFKCRGTKDSIWSVMNGGFDWKRCRHIYQLTGFTLILLILFIIFGEQSVVGLKDTEPIIEETETPLPETPERPIDPQLLDSPDITLEEILQVEEVINILPRELQKEYRGRLFALKNLYISGLMDPKHNVVNLLNIFAIHKGEFSPQQQDIIDWYVGLTPQEQDLWIDCGKVNSLADFNILMHQQVERFSSNERKTQEVVNNNNTDNNNNKKNNYNSSNNDKTKKVITVTKAITTLTTSLTITTINYK